MSTGQNSFWRATTNRPVFREMLGKGYNSGLILGFVAVCWEHPLKESNSPGNAQTAQGNPGGPRNKKSLAHSTSVTQVSRSQSIVHLVIVDCIHFLQHYVLLQLGKYLQRMITNQMLSQFLISVTLGNYAERTHVMSACSIKSNS